MFLLAPWKPPKRRKWVFVTDWRKLWGRDTICHAMCVQKRARHLSRQSSNKYDWDFDFTFLRTPAPAPHPYQTDQIVTYGRLPSPTRTNSSTTKTQGGYLIPGGEGTPYWPGQGVPILTCLAGYPIPGGTRAVTLSWTFFYPSHCPLPLTRTARL